MPGLRYFQGYRRNVRAELDLPRWTIASGRWLIGRAEMHFFNIPQLQRQAGNRLPVLQVFHWD
jgi:hypothetical protein